MQRYLAEAFYRFDKVDLLLGEKAMGRSVLQCKELCLVLSAGEYLLDTGKGLAYPVLEVPGIFHDEIKGEHIREASGRKRRTVTGTSG